MVQGSWGPSRGMIPQGLSEPWETLLAFRHVTLIKIQHLCLQHSFFLGGGQIKYNNRCCDFPTSSHTSCWILASTDEVSSVQSKPLEREPF